MNLDVEISELQNRLARIMVECKILFFFLNEQVSRYNQTTKWEEFGCLVTTDYSVFRIDTATARIL